MRRVEKSVSPFLDMKAQERNYRQHIHALQTAKPAIDTSSPEPSLHAAVAKNSVTRDRTRAIELGNALYTTIPRHHGTEKVTLTPTKRQVNQFDFDQPLHAPPEFEQNYEITTRPNWIQEIRDQARGLLMNPRDPPTEFGEAEIEALYPDPEMSESSDIDNIPIEIQKLVRERGIWGDEEEEDEFSQKTLRKRVQQRLRRLKQKAKTPDVRRRETDQYYQKFNYRYHRDDLSARKRTLQVSPGMIVVDSPPKYTQVLVDETDPRDEYLLYENIDPVIKDRKSRFGEAPQLPSINIPQKGEDQRRPRQKKVKNIAVSLPRIEKGSDEEERPSLALSPSSHLHRTTEDVTRNLDDELKEVVDSVFSRKIETESEAPAASLKEKPKEEPPQVEMERKETQETPRKESRRRRHAGKNRNGKLDKILYVSYTGDIRPKVYGPRRLVSSQDGPANRESDLGEFRPERYLMDKKEFVPLENWSRKRPRRRHRKTPGSSRQQNPNEEQPETERSTEEIENEGETHQPIIEQPPKVETKRKKSPQRREESPKTETKSDKSPSKGDEGLDSEPKTKKSPPRGKESTETETKARKSPSKGDEDLDNETKTKKSPSKGDGRRDSETKTKKSPERDEESPKTESKSKKSPVKRSRSPKSEAKTKKSPKITEEESLSSNENEEEETEEELPKQKLKRKVPTIIVPPEDPESLEKAQETSRQESSSRVEPLSSGREFKVTPEGNTIEAVSADVADSPVKRPRSPKDDEEESDYDSCSYDSDSEGNGQRRSRKRKRGDDESSDDEKPKSGSRKSRRHRNISDSDSDEPGDEENGKKRSRRHRRSRKHRNRKDDDSDEEETSRSHRKRKSRRDTESDSDEEETGRSRRKHRRRRDSDSDSDDEEVSRSQRRHRKRKEIEESKQRRRTRQTPESDDQDSTTQTTSKRRTRRSQKQGHDEENEYSGGDTTKTTLRRRTKHTKTDEIDYYDEDNTKKIKRRTRRTDNEYSYSSDSDYNEETARRIESARELRQTRTYGQGTWHKKAEDSQNQANTTSDSPIERPRRKQGTSTGLRMTLDQLKQRFTQSEIVADDDDYRDLMPQRTTRDTVKEQNVTMAGACVTGYTGTVELMGITDTLRKTIDSITMKGTPSPVSSIRKRGIATEGGGRPNKSGIRWLE